jgi:serine/threonine-protein kinase
VNASLADTLPAVCPHCGAASDLVVAGICAGCAFGLVNAQPRFIGQFAVLGNLGSGGNSDVYRVRDPWSPREVALKVLRGGELAHAFDRSAFAADLQHLSRLQHPNIVQVLDTHGVHEPAPYYTMQLVEGGALDPRSEQFRTPEAAAQLVATLARAVQFCHAAREPVLHLDIKPGNILIGHGGHPYLTDFGIAKRLEAAGVPTLTRAGTPAYMSPEQAAGRELSCATDIYSLGVVLYQLLTKTLPHTADTILELLQRIEHEPIQPPHRRVPELRRNLSRICMTALAPRPAQRYASAATLAEDLERYLRDEPPLLLPEARSKRVLYWLVHNPVLTAGFLVTLLFLFTLFASAVWLVDLQAREQSEGVLRELDYVARAQADALLTNMARVGQELARAARAIEERARTTRQELGVVGDTSSAIVAPTALSNVHPAQYYAGFEEPLPIAALTIFDEKCQVRQRFPMNERVFELSRFDYRAYCKAAQTLGEEAQHIATIAEAFIDNPDTSVRFPLVAPLFDRPTAPLLARREVFAGFLFTMVTARESMSRVHPNPEQSDLWRTVVIGPRDFGTPHYQASQKSASRYLVLAHPGLTNAHHIRGFTPEVEQALQAYATSAEPAQRFDPVETKSLRQPDWVDPVDGTTHWLAVLAPIGKTGYFVVIQRRLDAATRSSSALMQRAWKVGLPWAIALLVVWIALVLRVRRGRYFGSR